MACGFNPMAPPLELKTANSLGEHSSSLDINFGSSCGNPAKLILQLKDKCVKKQQRKEKKPLKVTASLLPQ